MNRSISSRMLVSIIPTVMVIFTAIIVGAVLMATAAQTDLAYQGAIDKTLNYANDFNAQLSTGQEIGRTLALSMAQNQTHNRQEVMDVLESLLDHHPDVLGTYVGYEPNAFDQADQQYANTRGSDSTGRFIPYWNKLSGSKDLSPLLDLETSDYYLVPKATKADSVIEPFVYEDTLLTSFISPILVNDQFVGISGVDYSLGALNETIHAIQVYDTGYAFLISNSGIFIAAPDTSMIGTKKLSELPRRKTTPIWQKSREISKKGSVGISRRPIRLPENPW